MDQYAADFTAGYFQAAQDVQGLKAGDVFRGAWGDLDHLHPDKERTSAWGKGYTTGYLNCVETRWPNGVKCNQEGVIL